MTLLRITGFLCLAILFCCKANSGTASENSSKSKSDDFEMTYGGFEKATVVKMEKGSGCPYILDMAKDSMWLDPINLEDAYKKDGIVIWVKYRRLRMPQRCENASPVELTEIKVS